MADDTSSTTIPPTSPGATPSDSAATPGPRAPFRHEVSAPPDQVALRDDLTGVQSSGTRAAQLSGEHFARLLYGPGTDNHLSPYGVAPVPNSLDSREK